MKLRADLHKVRPDMLSRAVILSLAVFMMIRISMVYVIGEEGIGMLSAPLEIYVLGCAVFLYSYERAVDSMIRLRSRREQYQNADYGMKIALRMAGLSALIIGVMIILLSEVLAGTVLGMQKAFMAFAAAGVCLILMGMQGTMRGYLHGFGAAVPVLYSMIVQAVLSFVLSWILAQIFYRYGLRMNALLRVEDCAPAYGALGAMTGIALSLLFSLIHITIVYRIRRGQIREKIDHGAPRYLDAHIGIGKNLKSMIAITTGFALLTIADEKIYFIFAALRGDRDAMIGNWGIYYGSFMSVIYLIALICAVPFIRGCYQFCARISHADLVQAGEKLSMMIHAQAILLIPVTAFVAILAEPIQTAFFGIPNDSAVAMTSFGSITVLLASFALIASCIMLRLHRVEILIVNSVLAFAVHVVMVLIMTIAGGMGLHADILAMMLMLAVYDAVTLMEISRMIHYHQEWLRSFAIPLISAGVAALVVYFLSRLLVGVIGEILSIVTCIVIGTPIYLVLLTVLKGINEYECYEIPGGTLLVRFARKLHLM
ncbi:MAG: polysaccharide biosynthesis C-terminal domain-containing protein [Butyrivibrio sp.]|jgi:O-antigen/teichoic acid export membrane protein|nr:polysaccharide biosynthesis C-terminal domain-containing protein [Butyrivibrio sp.]